MLNRAVTNHRFDDMLPDVDELSRLLPPVVSTGARVELWGALAVTGRAVVRRHWTDHVELDLRTFERLSNAREPAPDLQRDGPRQFSLLVGGRSAARRAPCSACFLEPGRQQCVACAGRGGQIADEEWEPCSACDGKGWLQCTVCSGNLHTFTADVAYYQDHVTQFAHVFAPLRDLGLRGLVQEFIAARTRVPDCLAFDLDETTTTTDAYRGRRQGAEHRGVRLGATLEHARRYVQRVRAQPSVVLTRHAAFVWPVAVLETERSECVVGARDEDGATRPIAVVAPGQPARVVWR